MASLGCKYQNTFPEPAVLKLSAHHLLAMPRQRQKNIIGNKIAKVMPPKPTLPTVT
jgi:hypothetical protein